LCGVDEQSAPAQIPDMSARQAAMLQIESRNYDPNVRSQLSRYF